VEIARLLRARGRTFPQFYGPRFPIAAILIWLEGTWCKQMSRLEINFSYLQSLIWTAIFVALMRTEATFTNFVPTDRLMKGGAIDMMLYMALFGVFTFVWAFVILTLPQYFQAEIVGASQRILGDQAWLGVWLALPVTAMLSWYCNDYLNPAIDCLGWVRGTMNHTNKVSRYGVTSRACWSRRRSPCSALHISWPISVAIPGNPSFSGQLRYRWWWARSGVI